jgi:hypothetical protein
MEKIVYCPRCIKDFGDSHKTLWRRAYYNIPNEKTPLYCLIHAEKGMIDVVRKSK